MELYKVPGVSETLDWVAALVALDRDTLDPAAVERRSASCSSRRTTSTPCGASARGASSPARVAVTAAPMTGLLDNLLVFGRLLRALGLDVHVGRLLDIAEALQHVDLGARDEVYHTCRALLVHRHEDLAIFDRAFDAFWSVTASDAAAPTAAAPTSSAPVIDSSGHDDGGDARVTPASRAGSRRRAADVERRARRWRTRTLPRSRPRDGCSRAPRSIAWCGRRGCAGRGAG